MPHQLLVNVITVVVPAGAFNYPVPHGLRSNDKAVAPTLILPAAQSAVSVVSANATNIYLANPSGSPVTATFRCERGLSNEVDAEAVAPFFQSTGDGTGGIPSRIQGGADPFDSYAQSYAGDATNGANLEIRGGSADYGGNIDIKGGDSTGGAGISPGAVILRSGENPDLDSKGLIYVGSFVKVAAEGVNGLVVIGNPAQDIDQTPDVRVSGVKVTVRTPYEVNVVSKYEVNGVNFSTPIPLAPLTSTIALFATGGLPRTLSGAPTIDCDYSSGAVGARLRLINVGVPSITLQNDGATATKLKLKSATRVLAQWGVIDLMLVSNYTFGPFPPPGLEYYWVEVSYSP